MAKLKLEVLRPARRCVGRNANGSLRFETFTPEYCQQQFERNSALLASGADGKPFPVPVCWEHRDDAKPGRLSRDDAASARAKGTAGFVDKYEIDAKNRVFATVDVPDEVDARQAEKTRFCSPEIAPFVDDKGKDWGEVFTHVALTPRPVQTDQTPVTRLSLTYAGPIRLSVDPKEGKDMADEADDKGKKKPYEAPKNDTPVDEGIKAVIEALRGVGMNIPEEVKDCETLVVAIKASGSGDEDYDDDDDQTPENVGPANGPVQMSLQKANERAEKLTRKDLEREVDRLLKTGRITPPIATGLKTRLSTVRLSFDDNGDPKPNAVTAEIEAYKKLPANQSWSKRGKRVRLSRDDVREVDAPENLRGERSDEEIMTAWGKT
jgi:hypothetical protein